MKKLIVLIALFSLCSLQAYKITIKNEGQLVRGRIYFVGKKTERFKLRSGEKYTSSEIPEKEAAQIALTVRKRPELYVIKRGTQVDDITIKIRNGKFVQPK